MQIVEKPLADLVPYAKNSRKHPKAQLEQLQRSLAEFGWTSPVLVDGENGIIAGHGRVLAAKALLAAGGRIPNWPRTEQVPTIELRHLTKEQARAYVIADNQLALGSTWDKATLSSEISELAGLSFDLSLLGFDRADLLRLSPGGVRPGLTDPDDAPDVQDVALARAGDVWILGDHRLACGDSENPTSVGALLNGTVPHLMVTDPPYGVAYDASWRATTGLSRTGAHGKVLNDDRADWRGAWALFPGDVAYVWHAGRFASEVQASLEACEFEIRSQIIWAKPRFAISRGHYHWQHEPCWFAVRGETAGRWGRLDEQLDAAREVVDYHADHGIAWYAVKKGAKGHWRGARDQSTLWEIPHAKSDTGHSTQKPVECMRRPMENNSAPGDAVYEPFSGSGTSIIAAEQIQRACYAMELNPAYVDVAIRRWQSFTGKAAVRKSDGITFAQLEESAPQGGTDGRSRTTAETRRTANA